MFVSVIELSPGSTLIELPVIIRRSTYDQRLQPWKRWSRLSSLLDVPFWDCNRNGFLSPPFTFWQTPKSQSSKFSVKVLKWFMNGGSIALGWQCWSVGPPLSSGLKYLNKWSPSSSSLSVFMVSRWCTLTTSWSPLFSYSVPMRLTFEWHVSLIVGWIAMQFCSPQTKIQTKRFSGIVHQTQWTTHTLFGLVQAFLEWSGPRRDCGFEI